MVMKLEFVVLVFVSLAYNVSIYAINQVLQFKCVSEVFCLFNNFKTLDEATYCSYIGLCHFAIRDLTGNDCSG